MTIDDQYWHSGSDKPKGCWFESNRGSLNWSFSFKINLPPVWLLAVGNQVHRHERAALKTLITDMIKFDWAT